MINISTRVLGIGSWVCSLIMWTLIFINLTSFLHLRGRSSCFLMSLVAWRQRPASHTLQQSDWHHCADVTKEKPGTKERPWGGVSLALYSSYRLMMEWQHSSFPPRLYLSCTLSPCSTERRKRTETWRAADDPQKYTTMLTVCCSCSMHEHRVGVQSEKLALSFPRTRRIISPHHEAPCFLSEEWKGWSKRPWSPAQFTGDQLCQRLSCWCF